MNPSNIITTNNTYSSQDDYQRFSVSKIKTYKDCSQMYKLKYIDKLDSYIQSNATLVGTLMHATLEYLYGVDDKEVQTAQDAFFKILAPEFSKLGFTSVESILGELLDYYQDINSLYLRASSNYKGIDAIRTGKGDVPKVPEMTGIWKSERKRLKLDERQYTIDHTIQTSKSGFEKVSITEVFSRALNLSNIYTTPNALEEILHLELPISHWDKSSNSLINAVPFPNCKHKDIYLNGYIDNISKVRVDGKTATAVIDYKTSREVFNTSVVQHNQQLLMYAAAASELLNCDIEYIGILSLLRSELILVSIDKEIQTEIITAFNKIIDKTINNDFVKHFPDTEYSTCLNNFGAPCPFLKNCWPNSYQYINRDKLSDDFLAEYI
jgi:CRISPR/Cas system-associated exonuclease Cas4 (RecB family)